MAEVKHLEQTPEAMLALALYRARHQYMKDAIADYGKNCPDPPPIEEVQKLVAKYVKRNLSDVVREMRDDD